MKTFIFFVLLKMTISSCSNFLVAGIHVILVVDLVYFIAFIQYDRKRNVLF